MKSSKRRSKYSPGYSMIFSQVAYPRAMYLRQRLHESGFICNRIAFGAVTPRRSRPLPKPGRFENADKSGAFSKRYDFFCRVNGETASNKVTILARKFKMVKLVRSAALAYTITTLISGLRSLFQLSCILISINREAFVTIGRDYLKC